MISLRLKVTSDENEPYIVRVWTERPQSERRVDEAFEASLISVSESGLVFEGQERRIIIHGVSPHDINGDVLFVNPKKGTAERLIRHGSPHNTFLITERCDQLCVMCSQPPKENHVDMFPYFEAAALLAPQNATIGLSGGEPTLYKEQLLGLLSRVMKERTDLQFHVLTNGQHFAQEDLPGLRSLALDRITWGVPLYSADEKIHDKIVGKTGAYNVLLPNLGFMARAGFRIELRTVLMQPNAEGLAQLAQFITVMLPFIETWAIMQMENIGYGRMNWNSLFFDSSQHFENVALALNTVHSRGLDAKLYNFPLCTVPEAYRNSAPATISDWKNSYLDECDGCSLQDACGGFFEWHPKNHGYGALGL